MGKLMGFFAAASLLLTATNAFASAPNYFNGFYVGIQGGVTQGLFEQNGDATTIITDPDLPDSVIHNISKDGDKIITGGTGGIQVGYGTHFNNFYLGGQIFGTLGSLETSSQGQLNTIQNVAGVGIGVTNISVNINSKLTNTYGISLIPGYLLTPDILIYAAVGIVRSQADLDATGKFQQQTFVSGELVDQFSPPPVHGSQSKVLTGYQLGLGLEKYLIRNLTFSASYIFSDYGNMDVDAITRGNVEGISTTLIGRAKTSIKTNTFLLSVNYRFS